MELEAEVRRVESKEDKLLSPRRQKSIHISAHDENGEKIIDDKSCVLKRSENVSCDIFRQDVRLQSQSQKLNSIFEGQTLKRKLPLLR